MPERVLTLRDKQTGESLRVKWLEDRDPTQSDVEKIFSSRRRQAPAEKPAQGPVPFGSPTGELPPSLSPTPAPAASSAIAKPQLGELVAPEIAVTAPRPAPGLIAPDAAELLRKQNLPQAESIPGSYTGPAQVDDQGRPITYGGRPAPVPLSDVPKLVSEQVGLGEGGMIGQSPLAASLRETRNLPGEMRAIQGSGRRPNPLVALPVLNHLARNVFGFMMTATPAGLAFDQTYKLIHEHAPDFAARLDAGMAPLQTAAQRSEWLGDLAKSESGRHTLEFLDTMWNIVATHGLTKAGRKMVGGGTKYMNPREVQELGTALRLANEQYKAGASRAVELGLPPPEGRRLFNEPNPETRTIAENYIGKVQGKLFGAEDLPPLDLETGQPAVNLGRPKSQINTALSKEIADAYEAMEHNPSDPQVKEAYDALVKETLDQYKEIESVGYKIEIFTGEGEPYKNSAEMIRDVRENKHLFVLPTDKAFGAGITEVQRAQNPLLANSGIVDANGKPLLVNDVFRFVHDFFGHTERGNSFGAIGEENAWDVHSRMYSPLARRAMTTETRGQNSWVNFGPHADKPVAERPFAEQKIGLLPEKYSQPDVYDPRYQAAVHEAKGGSAFNLKGEAAPREGYGLSIYPERGEITEGSKPGPEVFERFAEKNKDLLQKPDHYIGTWISEGKTYLDVSVTARDRTTAEAAGRAMDQIAIWDAGSGREIPVGGSGKTGPVEGAPPIETRYESFFKPVSEADQISAALAESVKRLNETGISPDPGTLLAGPPIDPEKILNVIQPIIRAAQAIAYSRMKSGKIEKKKFQAEAKLLLQSMIDDAVRAGRITAPFAKRAQDQVDKMKIGLPEKPPKIVKPGKALSLSSYGAADIIAAAETKTGDLDFRKLEAEAKKQGYEISLHPDDIHSLEQGGGWAFIHNLQTDRTLFGSKPGITHFGVIDEHRGALPKDVEFRVDPRVISGRVSMDGRAVAVWNSMSLYSPQQITDFLFNLISGGNAHPDAKVYFADDPIGGRSIREMMGGLLENAGTAIPSDLGTVRRRYAKSGGAPIGHTIFQEAVGGNVADIARALNDYTLELTGKPLFVKRGMQEQVIIDRFVKTIVPDMRRALVEDVGRAKNWYANTRTRMIAATSKIFPEIQPNSPAEGIFTTVLSILSNGNSLEQNYKSAINIWDYYKRDRKFPLRPPEDHPGFGGGWSVRGQTNAHQLMVLNDMLTEMGEVGFVDFMDTKHDLKVLRQYNKNIKPEGGPGEPIYGSFVFGPKLGAFYANMRGKTDVMTKDRWWNRTWLRAMGRLQEEKIGGETGVRPLGQVERRVADRAAKVAADKLGLTLPEFQAVVWAMEREIYERHGQKIEKGDFADVAERYQKELESQSDDFGYGGLSETARAGREAEGRGSVSEPGAVRRSDQQEKAVGIFGITDDPLHGGWMTSDGKMLDFSGPSGGRVKDHREISKVYPERSARFEPSSVSRALSDGMVRLKPENPGFEISGPLSLQQKRELKAWIERWDDGEKAISVDINHPDGSFWGAVGFKPGESADRIFSAIESRLAGKGESIHDSVHGFSEPRKGAVPEGGGDQSRPKIVYRGGPDSQPPRGKTAEEIVRYERETLGNADVVPEPGVDLKSIPSERLRWFATTKEYAKEFGEVGKGEPLGKDDVIVARDGEGGVLIYTPTPEAVFRPIRGEFSKLLKRYEGADPMEFTGKGGNTYYIERAGVGNHAQISVYIDKKFVEPGLQSKFHSEADKPGLHKVGHLNLSPVELMMGDVSAGVAKKNPGTLVAGGVGVDPPFRRDGVATAMYAYAERVTGKKIIPSGAQSTEAQHLWKSRGRAATWEEAVVAANSRWTDVSKRIRDITNLPSDLAYILEPIARKAADDVTRGVLAGTLEAKDFASEVQKRVAEYMMQHPELRKILKSNPSAVRYAYNINLDRMLVDDPQKAAIVKSINMVKPALEQIKGERLTNAEVLDAAQTSEVMRGLVDRESTKEATAAATRLRQMIATGNLEKGASADYLKNLMTLSSYAADTGRKLQAFKINVGQDFVVGSVKERVLKDLLSMNVELDRLIKAAESVDWKQPKEVAKFYHEFDPVSFKDLLTEYRYINMLSSPLTHIVNTFSNMLQVGGMMPGVRAMNTGVDLIASKLTGKQRTAYINAVPAYYKGALNSIPRATKTAIDAILGRSFTSRPDVRSLPTIGRLSNPALLPMQAFNKTFRGFLNVLEASDRFFSTIASGAEAEAISVNLRRAGKPIIQEVVRAEADARAKYSVFRAPLDPSNESGQGALLSAIDKLTRGIYGLRRVPGVGWIIPFVQTPTAILKQGLEFSPAGFATMIGSTAKTEQFSKALIGSMVTIGAASLVMNNESTWSVPRGDKAKAQFYDDGKIPYAIKINGTWISYSKLGPLAFPIALAASWKHYFEERPEEVDRDTMDRMTSTMLSWVRFMSDQSYLEGLRDMIELAEGDTGKAAKATQGFTRQVIPLVALQGWVNRIMDPVVRQPKTTGERMVGGLPGFAQQQDPRITPYGEIAKRGAPAASAFSPLAVSPARQADPVRDELARLGVLPSVPGQGQGEKKMSDEDYQRLRVRAGQALYKELLALVTSAGYLSLEDEAKKDLVERAMRRAHKLAKVST